MRMINTKTRLELGGTRQIKTGEANGARQGTQGL